MVSAHCMQEKQEQQPVASAFRFAEMHRVDTERSCSTSGITSTGAETFIIHKRHACIM